MKAASENSDSQLLHEVAVITSGPTCIYNAGSWHTAPRIIEMDQRSMLGHGTLPRA